MEYETNIKARIVKDEKAGKQYLILHWASADNLDLGGISPNEAILEVSKDTVKVNYPGPGEKIYRRLKLL